MDDAKLSGQTDVSRMLEGRAAGVSVQNVSGTFGAAPKYGCAAPPPSTVITNLYGW